MLTIITLCGAKGAGKNTFARILRELVPDAREAALADKLKNACSMAFGLNRHAFDEPTLKERYTGGEHFSSIASNYTTNTPTALNHHNLSIIIDAFGFQPTDALVEPHVGKRLYTPRQIAQYVGTEVLRQLHPDIHCVGLMKDAPKDGVLLVTDVRFPNELQFFASLKNVLHIPVAVRNAKAEAEAAKDPHPSEAYLMELVKQCFEFDNNGTLEEFEKQVQAFADRNFSKEAA